ncbi:MAG TPA: CHAT domain-containing protein [Isosphaeraceae bacterium]
MKIFISYAHDSNARSHAEKVRLLADRLKSLDLDVVIDQDNPDPDQGWLDWMEKQVKEAERILIVFTELYYSRWCDEDPSPSWGARFEGRIIKNLIGVRREPLSKFIPVLFEGGLSAQIPTVLLDRTRYELRTFSPDDAGFASLVKHLTGRDLGATGDVERPRSLQFELRARAPADGQAGGYVVRLEWDGNEPAEEAFDGDPLGSATIAEALRSIDAGRDEKEHLKIVGLQLWEGLMTGSVRDLFRAAWRLGLADGRMFHVRLTLPPELEGLPWEALYNEEENGFLAAREQYCVIRTGSCHFLPALARGGDPRPPGILLVVPKGSGLDLSRETQTIRSLAEVLGGAVRVGVLDDSVTLGRLGEEIERGGWDAVHFAGHGRLDAKRGAEIRLNDNEGAAHWVDADLFATAFNKGRVRLVVLNCCRGASASGSRIVAGLGPSLVGRRVVAVVAMRYEIGDDAALCFAERFYRVLLTGPQPGRVDLAIEAARVAVFQNPSGESQRGFVTPALYLAPGGETVLDLPRRGPAPRHGPIATATATHAAAGPPAPAPAGLPDGLLEAIRDRRCIPVLWVGLISGEAAR